MLLFFWIEWKRKFVMEITQPSYFICVFEGLKIEDSNHLMRSVLWILRAYLFLNQSEYSKNKAPVYELHYYDLSF